MASPALSPRSTSSVPSSTGSSRMSRSASSDSTAPGGPPTCPGSRGRSRSSCRPSKVGASGEHARRDRRGIRRCVEPLRTDIPDLQVLPYWLANATPPTIDIYPGDPFHGLDRLRPRRRSDVLHRPGPGHYGRQRSPASSSSYQILEPDTGRRGSLVGRPDPGRCRRSLGIGDEGAPGVSGLTRVRRGRRRERPASRLRMAGEGDRRENDVQGDRPHTVRRASSRATSSRPTSTRSLERRAKAARPDPRRQTRHNDKHEEEETADAEADST